MLELRATKANGTPPKNSQDDEEQKALQHFVLLLGQLVAFSIAGNRDLTAGVLATTTSSDLLV